MTRCNLRIRPAGSADLDVVVRTAEELAGASADHERAGARLVCAQLPTTLRERFAAALANPSVRILLAVEDHTEAGAEPVRGMAVLSVDTLSALMDQPTVTVHHLAVASAHRGHGVGRALLSEITVYAEQVGADHVVMSVAANGRESNRYFARLGFAPLVLRRVAGVQALRRTLGMNDVVDLRAHTRRRRASRALSFPLRGARERRG